MHHWLPLALVTAESWGHGHVSLQGCSCLSVHLPSLLRRTLGHSCLHLPSAGVPQGCLQGHPFPPPAFCLRSSALPWAFHLPCYSGAGEGEQSWLGRISAVCKGGVGKQLLTLRSCFCSWNESAFFQAFCLSSPPKAEVLQLTGLSFIAEEPQTGSAAAFTLLCVSYTWKCRDGVYQKKTEWGKMGQNWWR